MASYCRFCPALIQDSKYGGMADHVRVVHPDREYHLLPRGGGGQLLRRAKESNAVRRRRVAALRSRQRAAPQE